MKYLLDTNVLIQLLRDRGSPAVIQRLCTVDDGDAVTCSVVVAELLYGVIRSKDPARNLTRLHSVLSGFQSLPFEDAAAAQAASIRAALAASGTPVGPYDLQIAAVALAHDLTLVTHNTGEYARVPGLRLEDWQREI